MQAFKTQRLANKFPIWTKVRYDKSSLGQRIFATFANYFDFAEADVKRLKDEFFLYKKHLGLAHLYRVLLSEEDLIQVNLDSAGFPQTTYPSSVTGTHPSLGLIVLTRDEYIEDLLYGTPTRLSIDESISISSHVIWDSNSPGTINTIIRPERLSIYIDGSTYYKQKTLLKDRYFSGTTSITIKGLDINGIPIEEQVAIPDDGLYETQNIFSRLTEKPIIDGFNGRVRIQYKNNSIPFVVDPYHVGVTEELEGPLRLYLNIDTSNNRTFLEYKTVRNKLGSLYRTGQINIDNEVSIADQLLLDSEGNSYIASDLVVFYEDTLLYIVDVDGNIHVYEHGYTPFIPLEGTSNSTSTSIILIPLEQYVRLDSTSKMWTYFKQSKNIIERVAISRIRPSGTTEYLQANKTWSTTAYYFQGNLTAKSVSTSWSDITFDNTFDELGQWNFQIEVFSGGKATYYATAVMVDSLQALVTIPTGITDPVGIFSSRDGKLGVLTTDTLYYINKHRDTYYADVETQQLLLREAYDSVEVIY